MNRQPSSVPFRLRIGFLSVALAVNMLVGAFIGLLATYEPAPPQAAQRAQTYAAVDTRHEAC